MPRLAELEEARLLIEQLKLKRAGGNIVEHVYTAEGNFVPVIGLKPEVPRIELSKRIKGKEATLTMKAIELANFEGADAYARKIEFRLDRPDCGTQCRTVCFDNPVLVRARNILIPPLLGKGAQRFKKTEWEQLDPWQVFNNNKKIQNCLRARGIRYE